MAGEEELKELTSSNYGIEDRQMTKDDFEVLGKLGNGAYGRVIKA
jgi:hypothetical protein